MLIGLIRSLRPRQWAKNVFVLAPLVFAQQMRDPVALGNALLAFVAFCCASSAVYLFNDLRDREEDRQHPLKRHRPIAAGVVSVPAASLTAVALVIVTLAISANLGLAFTGFVLVYLLLNLLYSLGFKEFVILDVMIVSLGFVLRVLGGGAAIDVEVSAWLLLCTFLLALFLAFSKRRHELILMADDASNHRRVL
ncbi:MAG: UbiA family prenyltransferase, partial [Thermoanaerobaculia bacterium]